MLNHFYHEQKIPNEETLKTMEEVERGEGIIECENIEDLFKKLGI